MTITNKNYKRSQKGRSMVEMLGVLAIVGVLSVGGVYGYGVAMKKHKANELLHQASMHAATVSAQIMSGKEPTDLTDFGTGNTITLDIDSMAGNTTFKLKMTGIGKDVCTQMKNVKGGMVRDVDCDEATGNATITYYKNLATNDEEGKNSPIGGSSCQADIVNVYNCETKTTTPCCPDNENSCTQPTCPCDEENLCPGDQVCENGVCGCPRAEDYDARIGADGLTCCGESGSAWDKEQDSYSKLNINACGCPIDDYETGSRGTVSADGSTCCLDGKAFDEEFWTYIITDSNCL